MEATENTDLTKNPFTDEELDELYAHTEDDPWWNL